MDKNEFVRDFIDFNSKVKNAISELATCDIAMLYAIYKKDLRAERLNCASKGGTESIEATDKQKRYLLKLATKRGAKLTESDVSKMTRKQASEVIETLLERAQPPPH